MALEEAGRNPGRACEPGRLLACWFRFRCDEHVLQQLLPHYLVCGVHRRQKLLRPGRLRNTKLLVS